MKIRLKKNHSLNREERACLKTELNTLSLFFFSTPVRAHVRNKDFISSRVSPGLFSLVVSQNLPLDRLDSIGAVHELGSFLRTAPASYSLPLGPAALHPNSFPQRAALPLKRIYSHAGIFIFPFSTSVRTRSRDDVCEGRTKTNPPP